jgi:hypothetical protein
VRAELVAGVADRADLAAPRRVVLGDDAVAALADDLAVADDDRREGAAGLVDDRGPARQFDHAAHEPLAVFPCPPRHRGIPPGDQP